ncbi:MAG: hypothetical protein N2Z74_04900, partial [Syntrophales bacterium]|nr:hypothetical protein [Syntrophales bacterium]
MNVGQVEGMQPRFATPGEDAVFKTREIGEKNPVYKDVSEKGRAMEEMVALVEEMQMYLERTN